jgi:L-ascorbate metabolism protein UlaG (beta-lactamase superfamily)
VGALTATFLPARHESGRGLLDHRVTLWGAWALEGGGRRVYVAGDTAHGPHFAEAGARHGPFDLAIMGVGGFLPRRTNHHHHASPEEVIQGFRELRASRLMLVHWGTYPMGAEDTGAAPAATLAAARAAGVEGAVIVPRIGETIAL